MSIASLVSFNSRTPGGVRLQRDNTQSRTLGFQFTHPGRGATIRLLLRLALTACFNSRTPGGVRRCSALTNCYTKSVSIHAPREGCDICEESII